MWAHWIKKFFQKNIFSNSNGGPRIRVPTDNYFFPQDIVYVYYRHILKIYLFYNERWWKKKCILTAKNVILNFALSNESTHEALAHWAKKKIHSMVHMWNVDYLLVQSKTKFLIGFNNLKVQLGPYNRIIICKIL